MKMAECFVYELESTSRKERENQCAPLWNIFLCSVLSFSSTVDELDELPVEWWWNDIWFCNNKLGNSFKKDICT